MNQAAVSNIICKRDQNEVILIDKGNSNKAGVWRPSKPFGSLVGPLVAMLLSFAKF